MQIAEGKIIKRAFNLNKYCSTEKLFNPLSIRPTELAIYKCKLLFLEQLLENNMTRRIVISQLNNVDNLSKKSFLFNILDYLDITDDRHTEVSIRSLVKTKLFIMEEANFVERPTHDIQAIRYMLENTNMLNNLTLKEYLSWSSG